MQAQDPAHQVSHAAQTGTNGKRDLSAASQLMTIIRNTY